LKNDKKYGNLKVIEKKKGDVPVNIPISLIISFIAVLGKAKIMEIAREKGFLVRNSKLEPDTIVKVFTFGLWDTPNPSLKQTACKCEEIQSGLKISKVAIFNRLKTSAALLFIKRIAVEHSARKAVNVKTTGVLNQFTDIKICDSTKITLPDKLADTWKGLGGNNAKAALKIRTVCSLKTKTICNMELMKVPGTDASYNHQLLKQINAGELAIVDIEVWLGVHTSDLLKCRLIAIRLPDDIANERRRKAHKKAKAQGKTLSNYEVELLGWNILITNAPACMLPASAANELYRSRWQIELLFKACKSHLNLDKVGSCGKDQLDCLLYGRLIAIVLTFVMYSALQQLMYLNKGSVKRFMKND
jgi:hypothetical protein